MSQFGGGYHVETSNTVTAINTTVTFTVPANKFIIISAFSIGAASSSLSINNATIASGASTVVVFPGGIYVGPGGFATINSTSTTSFFVSTLFSN